MGRMKRCGVQRGRREENIRQAAEPGFWRVVIRWIKKALWCAAAAFAVYMLTSCQPAPDSAAVTSKNDGKFDAALESERDTVGAETEAAFVYQASFTNTAGDIAYTVDVEIPAVSTAVPVIQVRPAEIPAELAQQVASVLFDGAALYEYSTELSKAEIEESILALRQLTGDWDALVEYYGGNEETAETVKEHYEARIAALEALYADAPETVELQLCQWTFYPETHYISGGGADSETMCIKAVGLVNGWPVSYTVRNRSTSGWREHSIDAMLDLTEVDAYAEAEEPPGEEEIESVRAEARTMLDEMGFSDWVIASCEAVRQGLPTGQYSYMVEVTALPTYEGVPVMTQEFVSSDELYAAFYAFEEINFVFCGEELYSFWYAGALEVVDTINSNVPLLTAEEIAARLEQQLAVTDISSYQPVAVENNTAPSGPAVAGVSMTVSEAEFGLTRVRIQNNTTDYYLVPAYTFRGAYALDYADGTASEYEDVTLLVINAVDGSIIYYAGA